METRKSKLTECKINQWSLKNVQRTNEGEKKIGLPRNTHWTVKEDNQINKKKNIHLCSEEIFAVPRKVDKIYEVTIFS